MSSWLAPGAVWEPAAARGASSQLGSALGTASAVAACLRRGRPGCRPFRSGADDAEEEEETAAEQAQGRWSLACSGSTTAKMEV